jgi:hypothetical protein
MRRALALLVLAFPSLARADAFVPPEGKDGVEVVIGLENAADYPQYTFVVYHDCSSIEGGHHTIIAALDDDDGLGERFDPEFGCDSPYLYAFPRDAFSLVDDELPPAATAQLTDDPPKDARVLRTRVDGEPLWWVPDDLPLRRIRDVYRVEIAGTSLNLTPTRVIFEFDNGGELSKPFYKGKRPRIPRASEVPPDPPPEPAAPPAPAPSDTPPPAPAPAASTTPSPAEPAPAPSASPAPPPVAAASTAPAPAEPSRIQDLLADIPPPLLYGGGCLLVALLAGVALRRR